MIYLLLTLSLAGNGILVWYIRTLIKNYLFDATTVDKFKEMLEQYANSLTAIYKLEELYGDETVKKAIVETKFVIEACEEFKGSFGQTREPQEETEEPSPRRAEPVIRLREGESVSQPASNYKRVVFDSN